MARGFSGFLFQTMGGGGQGWIEEYLLLLSTSRRDGQQRTAEQGPIEDMLMAGQTWWREESERNRIHKLENRTRTNQYLKVGFSLLQVKTSLFLG
jgi:hypothetical protein